MQLNYFWTFCPQNQLFIYNAGVYSSALGLSYPNLLQNNLCFYWFDSSVSSPLLLENNFQTLSPENHSEKVQNSEKLKTEDHGQCWIKAQAPSLEKNFKEKQKNEQSHNDFSVNGGNGGKRSLEITLNAKSHQQNQNDEGQPNIEEKVFCQNMICSGLYSEQADKQAKQSQLNGVQLVKQHSKKLIISILKNGRISSEQLQQIKTSIAIEFGEKLAKSKTNIQENLSSVIKILVTKFTKIKKTKEEMIKYIFRKIFNVKKKPQNISQNSWKTAQKIYQKNTSTYRSMNKKFVRKQFQSPIFIELFNMFLADFNSNFETENQDRIDKLNLVVASAIVTQQMTKLKEYKKLPWNQGVVQNIQNLFLDLKDIQKNIKFPKKLTDLMPTEQIK